MTCVEQCQKERLVSWADFEKLSGGVREATRGDAAKRLERRCVWETTCSVTGMPNAYAVSVVREDRGKKRKDDVDRRREERRYDCGRDGGGDHDDHHDRDDRDGDNDSTATR